MTPSEAPAYPSLALLVRAPSRAGYTWVAVIEGGRILTDGIATHEPDCDRPPTVNDAVFAGLIRALEELVRGGLAFDRAVRVVVSTEFVATLLSGVLTAPRRPHFLRLRDRVHELLRDLRARSVTFTVLSSTEAP